MSYHKEYERWLASDKISDVERAELLAIRDDDKEIESRFFAPLSFGTAGLRGVLGAGINRMNVHTVRQATQGLANLICSMGKEAQERGVAIAMDSRNFSDVFAKESASVLAANGIKVFLFESLRPTPELSFAVLSIGTIAGINITASHNPKEYNGYKAYWEDGAQLPPKQASIVAEEIAKCDIFEGVKSMDLDLAVKKGIVTILGEEVDEAFLHHVLDMAINKEAVAKVADDFKVVYTPFHGTGWRLVPEILRRIGIKNIITVDEQMVIDGNFPTVKNPNPENKEEFTRAIEIARDNGVDLIIGTDPDADRVGVVVRAGDDYVTISGNQMGVLLLDYIITAKKETGTMPEKPVALKTIVTTELARIVCEKNGIKIYDTFTGFKFLAEKINALQAEGCEYLLAFEESYGYLVGDYARDKDAVVASMMIAEMAAYYAGKGMNLYDAMCSLYERYGYFAEKNISITMPGVDGLRDMARLMTNLRETPPEMIAGVKVKALRDYQNGTRKAGNEVEQMELSGSNVLYFEMEDGTSFIVRPSGTEPKVKVYIMASGKDSAECDAKIAAFTEAAKALTK